jgi:hypothetical protein
MQPSSQSETWVLIWSGKNQTHMRFLAPNMGVTLRNKLQSREIRKMQVTIS